jgi:hypothetical protein
VGLLATRGGTGGVDLELVTAVTVGVGDVTGGTGCRLRGGKLLSTGNGVAVLVLSLEMLGRGAANMCIALAVGGDTGMPFGTWGKDLRLCVSFLS